MSRVICIETPHPPTPSPSRGEGELLGAPLVEVRHVGDIRNRYCQHVFMILPSPLEGEGLEVRGPLHDQ